MLADGIHFPSWIQCCWAAGFEIVHLRVGIEPEVGTGSEKSIGFPAVERDILLELGFGVVSDLGVGLGIVPCWEEHIAVA